MNEKEMIGEMATDMNFACIELSKEQRLEIARVLINLGYSKIPEGSVVLTREEYDKKKKHLQGRLFNINPWRFLYCYIFSVCFI